MSSAVAGKFQDHYEVLGIDPKSDSATIKRAHAQLAEKYRPDNPATGDPEKFEAVKLALEVLSDADLRSTFDKLKGVGSDDIPKFGTEFFEALGHQTGLRTALLSILYDRRRTKPFTPSLSVRHVENMLVATAEQLSFTLWYLKQRNLAASDDKSNLLITVEGMEYLETNRPTEDQVMPYIKPAALATPKAPPKRPLAAVASKVEKSIGSPTDSITSLASKLRAKLAPADAKTGS